MSDYDLTLGLPHTNRFGLWEPLLMMQAGHAQWQAIAEAIGKPLSLLRSRAGGEVYAAFYYIETTLPPGFSMPNPNDAPDLREDEEPLEDESLAGDEGSDEPA